MRRWLRIVGIGLAGLLLVVALVAVLALRTTTGARFVLDRVVPEEVQVGAIDGSLWGPLVLEDVRYAGAGAEARVARVRFAWRPMRFVLRRVVEVTALDVDSARVELLQVDDADEADGVDDEAGGPPSIPVAVRFEGVRGRWIRVLTAAGDTIRAGLLALDGSARQDTFDLDTLRLQDFDARGNRFQVDAGGRLVSGARSARDTMGLDVDWSGRLADGTVLDGSGTVRGAAGALVVDHRLSGPIPARTEATIRDPWRPDSLRWEMTTDVPRFTLAELRNGLAGELGLTVRATGGMASAVGRIDARGAYPGVGETALTLAAAYRGDTVTVDSVRVRRTEGAGTVRGAGRVVLSGSGPSGDAELAWSGLGWPLDSAALASPDGTLRLVGRMDDFRADASFALRQPDRPLGRWTVRTAGGYADGRLTVGELVAENGGGTRVTATADVAFTDGPDGEAELRWTGLGWPVGADTVRVASPDGWIRLQGSVQDLAVAADASVAGPGVPLAITRVRLDVRGRGSPDSVRARIEATGRAGDRPVLAVGARGSFRTAERVLTVDTLSARLPATGGRVAMSGVADLDDPDRRLDVRARWSGLGWPLDSARYRSESGRVDIRSAGRRITARADFQLGGETLPTGRWQAAGQGDTERFTVDSIRGQLLDGEILATGTLRPDSGAWDLEVTGDSLAPDGWRPDWPGRVGFAIRTRGALAEDGPRYTVGVDTVHGVLRGRDVAGFAAVEGAAGRVRVDTVRLRLGESGLDAAGTIGDTLAVGWRVVIEELAAAVPDATGRLVAEGRVTGPRDRPTVDLSAQGRGIGFAGWAVDTVSARVEVPDGGRGRSSATAHLGGITGPSAVMDSVKLEVRGTRADHAIAVTIRAPRDVLEAQAVGRFGDSVWVGEVRRLRLRSNAVGEWRLREPVAVTAGRDSGSVGRLCWDGSGELCGDAAWGADGVRWDGTGRRLPIQIFGPVLPGAVTGRGELTLETRGHAAPGAVPTGMLRVRTEDGEVDYAPDAGRVVTQTYESLVVDVESDSSGVDARADLDLGALGRLTAAASLPGTAPLPDRSIDGRLDLHLEDDGTVSRYFPAFTRSQGTADVGIQVSGRVREPNVDGEVRLSGVAAEVTTAGIRLTDGELEARSTPTGEWEIDGGILSDSSRLSVMGSVRPPAGESPWSADIRVEGTGVPVFDTPEFRIIASPELAVRASPDSVAVDGSVTVPRARISIRELEGNVAVSPDVVIVGADGETADSMVTPATVRGDVLLVLGDSVMLDALGLTGRLDGRLTIAALPGRPPVASGELVIHDGRYRIYRQTFQVDEGRLLYASTPLPNPALELRITRSRDEVTAGMEITGRARDPRVRLFSDPALSDEQILAYLIVGRPLRRLNQQEGSQVESMARSVGVAGGNLLLARLSSAFGLETARIERTTPDQDGSRRTSLVLGTEILPRVQVDYAIGFGAAANVLRLRYRVTEHWIFQTESGQETGADILYTFNAAPRPVGAPVVPRSPPRPPR